MAHPASPGRGAEAVIGQEDAAESAGRLARTRGCESIVKNGDEAPEGAENRQLRVPDEWQSCTILRLI